MEPARCSSCHALLPRSAAWCSLCFAPAATAADRELHRPPAGAEAVDPLTAPLSLLLAEPAPATPSPSAPDPVLPAAPGPAAPPAMPGWPCAVCGGVAAFDTSSCPECGAGFLAGTDHGVSLRVPGFGDLAKAGPGARLLAATVGMTLLGLVFLLLLFIGGSLL